MTYPNLTDEEIQKLRDAIDNTLDNMKSDIRKKKLKVFGRTILSLVIITGGVALAIVFPSSMYRYRRSWRSCHANRRKQWGALSGERH